MVTEDDLARSDVELLRILDSGLDEASRRAGDWLACRPGCSQCCTGPFPITRLDAWRLGRELSELAREDPARASRIVNRARKAVMSLSEGYPGDAADGRLVADVDALDRFFERHGSLPCPVLDPDSGRCELYGARPVACRIYGPPLRLVDDDAPPCRLCFDGAPREVVERCRFEPDEHGLEEAILSTMEGAAGEDWETCVPFAVLRQSARPPFDPPESA